MGILIGAYGRIISRDYGNCFSELFAFSMDNMRNNQFFDAGIANTDTWYGYPLFAA